MSENALQNLCDAGQQQLMETSYLQAAHTLAKAEAWAWKDRDFDTLARLYLPLQEARRQIRQRCGEGPVRMHLLAASPDDSPSISTADLASGQLLIAGWKSIQPAIRARQLIAQQQTCTEVFLAAVYPIADDQHRIILFPTADAPLPDPAPSTLENLRQALPPACVILPENQLPPDAPRGTADTYAAVMSLWEKLHTPFLNQADSIADPIARMQQYRLTLQVDPACELAHQFLADIARQLARST